MYVKWIDDKHSLGIEAIDNQHKELFLLVNRLAELAPGPDYPHELIKVFKQLYAYTHYHFNTEGEIFRKYDYPGRDRHNKSHNEFTAKIKTWLTDYRDKPNLPLAEPLDFLVNWIISHIQGEDKAYALYFRDHKIAVEAHFSPAEGKEGEFGEAALNTWNDQNLKMEIEGIDGQHKELVFILQQANDLHYASPARARAFLPGIIKKLYWYSQFHFSYEEELMAKHDYPGLAEHRKLHSDFILRIQDFAREYNLDKETLQDEIVAFLKDWALQHILKEDTKYKQHIQNV
jgi:hemerythrin-like metal-binding protein